MMLLCENSLQLLPILTRLSQYLIENFPRIGHIELLWEASTANPLWLELCKLNDWEPHWGKRSLFVHKIEFGSKITKIGFLTQSFNSGLFEVSCVVQFRIKESVFLNRIFGQKNQCLSQCESQGKKKKRTAENLQRISYCVSVCKRGFRWTPKLLKETFFFFFLKMSNFEFQLLF